jgi:peptidoglycan hydrolase CwlO-like protein
MNNKIIVAAIAVIVIFLLGFVPQYIKANRLEKNCANPDRRTPGLSFGT